MLRTQITLPDHLREALNSHPQLNTTPRRGLAGLIVCLLCETLQIEPPDDPSERVSKKWEEKRNRFKNLKKI